MASTITRLGLALQFVPDSVKTHDLCVAAVVDCAAALEFVPDAMKTAEMCTSAVDYDISLVRFIPEAVFTPEIGSWILCEWPSYAGHIPASVMKESVLAAARWYSVGIKAEESALETELDIEIGGHRKRHAAAARNIVVVDEESTTTPALPLYKYEPSW